MSLKSVLMVGLLVVQLFPFFRVDAQEAGKKDKIVIDITNPNFRRFVIAVPKFYNINKKPTDKEIQASELFAKTIAKFLDYSGVFQIFDEKQYIEITPDKVKLDEWKPLKVDGLISGSFEITGKGMATEIKMFDVPRGQMIIWKKYSNGKLEDVREIAKRFCNEIMYMLTGEDWITKSKVLFLRKQGQYKKVYMMDIDGEEVTPLVTDNAIHLTPNWSPDGRKIIYTSYKNGNPDLYIYSLATKKSIMLSNRSGLNAAGSFSPDGSKIAFTRSRNGDSDLYTINTDGSEFRSLVTGYGLDIEPMFSPDAKKLAFVSGRSGSPHVWIMDMLSHKIDKLTNKGRYNADPAWSPDGKKIAFAGFDNGHFDIYLMNPDVENPNFERLTINSNENEHPTWSPDGRQIMFQSNRDGQYEIYLMNADGSNQRRITSGLGECTSPRWSPKVAGN